MGFNKRPRIYEPWSCKGDPNEECDCSHYFSPESLPIPFSIPECSGKFSASVLVQKMTKIKNWLLLVYFHPRFLVTRLFRHTTLVGWLRKRGFASSDSPGWGRRRESFLARVVYLLFLAFFFGESENQTHKKWGNSGAFSFTVFFLQTLMEEERENYISRVLLLFNSRVTNQLWLLWLLSVMVTYGYSRNNKTKPE